MGLWAFGKKALNSTIGASMQPLDTIFTTKITALQSQITTLQSQLTALQSHIDGISNIKSVQRGTFSMSVASITVAISSVNISKCFVVVNESNTNSNKTYSGCYISAMTSTSITISSYLDMTYAGSWQVIEFN